MSAGKRKEQRADAERMLMEVEAARVAKATVKAAAQEAAAAAKEAT